MTINWSDLTVFWTLNLFDFVMLYLIVNNLIGYRSIATIQKTTWKTGVLALGYGIAMGTVFYISNPITHQIIGHSAVLVLIWMMIKTKPFKMGIADIILIFFLKYLVLTLFQLTSLTIFNSFMNISITTNLLISMTSIITIYITGLRVDFNKLLIFISNKALVRLFLFIFVLIFIGIFALLRFENIYVIDHILLITPFVIIASVGLVYSTKYAYQYTDVLPSKYHDTGKLMSILDIKTRHAKSVQDLEKIHEKIIELMGMEARDYSEFENLDTLTACEHTISESIKHLKLDKRSTVEVITNLQFRALNEKIDDITIAYILGILLENAIETGTKKPIFVDVLSTHHNVIIKVSNEAKKKTKEELEKMLLKGHSTKGEIGRGFGLAKLKKTVKKDNGEITISQTYNNTGKCNYLTIMIDFLTS